jgi:cyclic pyranopterin phosphate synthase
LSKPWAGEAPERPAVSEKETASKPLTDALDSLLAGKPERHQFRIDGARPSLARHMSVTGG